MNRPKQGLVVLNSCASLTHHGLLPLEILSRIYFFPFFKNMFYTLGFLLHKSNWKGEGEILKGNFLYTLATARVYCIRLSSQTYISFLIYLKTLSGAQASNEIMAVS
jgi:uncharacterized membrane protein